MKLNDQGLPRQDLDTRGKALLRRLAPRVEVAIQHDDPFQAMRTASDAGTRFSPVEYSFFASTEPLSPGVKGIGHHANSMGFETERFFLRGTQEIGLQGDAHADFIQLVEEIQRTETFHDCTGTTFIADCVFEWLHAHDTGLTVKTLIEYVLAQAEGAVCERTIAIPVAMTTVEEPLPLGRIILKPYSAEQISIYTEQWRASKKDDGKEKSERYDPERFFAHLGHVASWCCLATFTTVAEPRKAVSRALEETERSLALLRFLAPANLMPGVPCHTVPLGQENVQDRRFLVTCNGNLTHGGSVEDHWRAQVWEISAQIVINMRGAGLDTLSRLLAAPTLTPYQDKLVDALMLYGRAPLAENLTDKLLFTMFALEALLLKNNVEPIQKNVAERMAMVVGRSIEERQDIIANLRQAYGMRSSFVHHGKSFDARQQEPLIQFMHNAWRLFQEAIGAADEFETRENWLDAVDELKFS